MNEFTTPEYRLSERVRVDHEKEFYLTLYIHEQLRLSGWGEKWHKAKRRPCSVVLVNYNFN